MRSDSGSIECDGCGKRLPQGVTFCVGCGTHNYAAAEKMAAVARQHDDRLDAAHGRAFFTRWLRVLARLFR